MRRLINSQLQKKDSLLRIISYLLTTNGLNYLVLFLASVLIFRNVDKSFYGVYVVLMSLFAFPELLMAGFNETITRFIKDKIPLADKQSIILNVLYYKLILLSAFTVIIYMAWRFSLFELLINNYENISDGLGGFIWIAILNSYVGIFLGVNSNILVSQYDYRFSGYIGLIRNIVYLMIVFGLTFYTHEYIYYLYCNFTIGLFLLVVLSLRINRVYPDYSFMTLMQLKPSSGIYKQYIIPYGSPLTVSSILTYVKNHLPIIILGKDFALEDVAFFSVIKVFFKALHGLTSSFLDQITSKFIALKDNYKKWALAVISLFYGGVLIRVVVIIGAIFFSPYFFEIYKIEDTSLTRLVFYLLSAEFFIAGLMNNFGFVLRMEDTTRKVLMISLIRFVVELSLIYFLLPKYGVVAAALILLLARYVETCCAYLLLINKRFLRHTVIFLIGALPVVYYFVGQVIS